MGKEEQEAIKAQREAEAEVRKAEADKRRALAEQIIQNPLYLETMNLLYQTSVNECINAAHDDDRGRADAAAHARAVIAFRTKLESHLLENRPPKDAPA